jgi:Helix-turn-helix domain
MAEITTAEAARRLGITQTRVSQMLRTGDLAGRQLSARSWLVDMSSVQDRKRLGIGGGRPWSTFRITMVLEVLSGKAQADSRTASLIRSTETDKLWRRIEQAVHVRTYAARNLDLVRAHLALTGESALDDLGERLVGEPKVLHGYLRPGVRLDNLADEAGMVEDSSGSIAIYELSTAADSGLTDVDSRVLRALIAADSARSSATRIHSAGVRALDQMRSTWLAQNT